MLFYMILGQFFTEIAKNGLRAMLLLLKCVKMETNELFVFSFIIMHLIYIPAMVSLASVSPFCVRSLALIIRVSN